VGLKNEGFTNEWHAIVDQSIEQILVLASLQWKTPMQESILRVICFYLDYEHLLYLHKSEQWVGYCALIRPLEGNTKKEVGNKTTFFICYRHLFGSEGRSCRRWQQKLFPLVVVSCSNPSLDLYFLFPVRVESSPSPFRTRQD